MKNIEIATQRLPLKPFDYKDLNIFIKYQEDADFKRHMGGVLDADLAREKFELYHDFFIKYGYGFFSIYEKNCDEWIGQAGVTTRSTTEFIEIGWAIVPEYQGKGYATEAVNAAINWCRQKFGWNKYYFCIEPDNIPSIRLAEKLGGINIGKNKLPAIFEGKGVEVWELTF